MTHGDEENVIAFPGPREPENITLHDMIEALLFASGEPVEVEALVDAIGTVDAVAVRAALGELAARDTGGIRVVAVAGGWQMRTDPRFADAIRRLRGGKPTVMSKATLEILAVVAYRQPVTRAEIDELRGVNSGGVLKQLLDKGYVRVSGRRQEPGRPLEYRTTQHFLEMFEIESLDALPTLDELESLAKADGRVPDSLGALLRDSIGEE